MHHQQRKVLEATLLLMGFWNSKTTGAYYFWAEDNPHTRCSQADIAVLPGGKEVIVRRHYLEGDLPASVRTRRWYYKTTRGTLSRVMRLMGEIHEPIT